MAHARSAHAIRPRLLDMTIRAILAGMAVSAPALHADEDKTRTLEQVTVIAQQDSNKAGSTKVISTDELNKRGESPTMGNLLRYEPLISAPATSSGGGGNVYDGAGNNGYNIRGVEGNRVALDIDGISLPDAAAMPDATANGRFAMGRDYIDPEMFREVRIESGTTTAGRGAQGLGGSVAFVTKSPEDYVNANKPSHVEFKTGYHSVNESYVNAVTGAIQVGGTQALLAYSHRDGEETQSEGRVAPNGEKWNSDAVLAKLQQQISERQRIGLVLDYFQRETDRQLGNRVTASYPDGANQESTTERTRISLEHRFTPGSGWIFDTLDSRVYLQDASIRDLTLAPRYILGGNTFSRRLDTDFTNESTGLTLDATKSIDKRHAIAYGISVDETESDRPWKERRVNLSSGAVTTPSKSRMADSTVLKIGSYFRDDIGFTTAGGRKITLTPGLRAEYQRFNPDEKDYAVTVPGAAAELESSSDLSVLPSLGLAVELKPGFSAYAQLSRGARVPNASEKTGSFDNGASGYAIIGNPDLKKETSTAAEIGLKGTPAQGVSLHTAVFQTKYKNFIDYVNLGADPVLGLAMLYRPMNIGDVNIWGAELSTRADLGTWLSPIDGSYVALSVGSSRGEAKRRDTGARGDVASVAPARGSLTLGYDAPSKRFGIAATTTHSKSKQAGPDIIAGVTTTRFDVKSYTIHDLSAYWNVSKKLSASAGLYNIGDKKYWDYASVRGLAATDVNNIERQAMPGRAFAVSLNLKF